MMTQTLSIGASIFGLFWTCNWVWAGMGLEFGHVQGLEYYTVKPSYIESCRIYEANFTACSTRSIQGFINQVIKGIPEIEESFGPLDPRKRDPLLYLNNNSSTAHISVNLTNLVVQGWSKMLINESSISKKDFSWKHKIYLPRLRLDGQYQMQGRFLMHSLNVTGQHFMELDDLNMLLNVKTHLYEKAGFTFFNVTDVKARLNVTGVQTNFENLFNGRSKELELSTNQFFNDNWRDFFETVRPLVVKTIERTVLDLFKTMFSLIPANFFIEDIPNSLALYGRKSKLS